MSELADPGTPLAERQQSDSGETYSWEAATNLLGTVYTPVSQFTTPINHAPLGTSATVTAGLNTPYTLKSLDFGFTDPNDLPGNIPGAGRENHRSFPTAGTLTDNGIPVSLNQIVSVADIDAGKLVFTRTSQLPSVHTCWRISRSKITVERSTGAES